MPIIDLKTKRGPDGMFPVFMITSDREGVDWECCISVQAGDKRFWYCAPKTTLPTIGEYQLVEVNLTFNSEAGRNWLDLCHLLPDNLTRLFERHPDPTAGFFPVSQLENLAQGVHKLCQGALRPKRDVAECFAELPEQLFAHAIPAIVAFIREEIRKDEIPFQAIRRALYNVGAPAMSDHAIARALVNRAALDWSDALKSRKSMTNEPEALIAARRQAADDAMNNAKFGYTAWEYPENWRIDGEVWKKEIIFHPNDGHRPAVKSEFTVTFYESSSKIQKYQCENEWGELLVDYDADRPAAIDDLRLTNARRKQANLFYQDADYGYEVAEAGGWEILDDTWSRKIFFVNPDGPALETIIGSLEINFQPGLDMIKTAHVFGPIGDDLLKNDRLMSPPEATRQASCPRPT